MKQGVVRTVARTLRQRPGLVAFPLLTVAGWAVVAAVAWLTPLSGAWYLALRGHTPTPGQDAGLAALLLVMWGVSTFGNAALLHAVHRLARGERPSVSAVLAGTVRRLPVLLRWLGVRATAGLLLRGLEVIGLGPVFGAIAGFSWSMVCYFALPVLVVEDAGMVPSLRRSAAMARRYAGDQVSGTLRAVAIAAGVFVVALAALIAGVRAGAALPVVLTGVVVLLLLTALVIAVGSGIFRMSLYLRATASRPARTPATAPAEQA